MRISRIALTLYLLFLGSHCISQTDKQAQKRIIEGVGEDLMWSYVNIDKAIEMSDFLNNKYKTGGYDTTLNIDEFTFEITKDLRQLSEDEHIYVAPVHRKLKYKNRKNPYRNIVKQSTGEITKLGRYRLISFIQRIKWKFRYKKFIRRVSKDNFMYGDIKILPGNIGYIEFFDFNACSFYRQENKGRIKLKSALNFLSNTNSIIIDLRNNTGGYVKMAESFVANFSDFPETYFLTTEYRFVLDTIPTGKDTIFTKKWTTPQKVKNNKMKDKDIYVLTSKYTFSAAEATSYFLKKNANATIIGEKTRGGGNGHFGGYYRKDYVIVVPSIKVFDEETNYTWEGKGIKPDIYSDYDSTLATAHNIAFNKAGTDTLNLKSKIYRKSKNKRESRTYYYKPKADLNDYCGEYKRVFVYKKGDNLFMEYDKRPPVKLIPKSKDIFYADQFKYVNFIRNNEGQINEINLRWLDRYLEKYRKENN